ncbi:MAG: HAMP domain-containing protein [Planctomycetes bacterium]|nr:HAMP domain-containing protein [Planctomycetota bacterium]
MVGITLAGALILLVAGQLLANGIVRPIDRSIGLLEQLAAGKLTARLDHSSRDEIGRLAAAMNATAEGIRSALGADEVDWAAVAKQRSELERVEAMTQNALTPMVYVDTAGIVRAMNPVAGKSLRALESALPKRGWLMNAAASPMFGAQPEFAAALAAPIHLLPRKLRLEVGETTLDAQVCAIQDSKGELSGRMVSWEDVTQKLATESGVSRTAQSLAAAATQLKAISVRMTDSAGETSKEATRVAGATETVHKNMNTIAASSEEMNSAIREIARSSAEASQIAAQAVEAAKGTNDTVQRLNESSAKIDRVIKVIHDVAEQTNLLALNATIEAARAGEAGKGFAVVANEVKQLAGETGKATKDIESSIVAIQSDVQRAVGEIAAISKVIARIHDIQNSIASAVEEQSATTQEISRNVAEAATRASEIVEGVTTVAKAAETTAQGASETQGAADSLDSLAGELEQQVAATAVAV